MRFAMRKHLDRRAKRKLANAIVSGVIMIVAGGAALLVGYIISGNLDAQFNHIASTTNLSSDYTAGMSNTRTEILAAFGLVGIVLIIVGAGLVIKSLGVMST